MFLISTYFLQSLKWLLCTDPDPKGGNEDKARKIIAHFYYIPIF